MKKYIIVFLLMPVLSFSQSPTQVPEIFPVSPEALKLGEFGDIPVNLSTGTQAVNVPIFKIEEGGFVLPIQLNYHYSGLVVDQIPGQLGLGWNLDAGGMVTRQVMGRPDEDTNGYIGQNRIGLNWVLPYYNGSLTTSQKNDLNANSANGTYDTQPDKFMVNVGNMNATFYFDENKNPVIKPYKPYKIEVINSNLAYGFKITDDNGIIYIFDRAESTKRLPPYTGIGEIIATPINGYNSGWKLGQIILTNNRTIDFTYSQYTYSQKVTYQNATKQLPNAGVTYKTTDTHYEINTKVLNKISFPLGEVVINNLFQAVNEPNDYLGRLNTIEIKNLNNVTINNYIFKYDDISKTRKLLSEIVVNNDIANNYKFQYKGVVSDDIPFYQQDFWGYSNANSNYNKLINLDDLYLPRQPSFAHSSNGALTKITYPTKGTSEFAYESNTYDPGVNGDELDDDISNECANLNKGIPSVGVGLFASTYTKNVEELDVQPFTVTSSNFYMKLELSVTKNTAIGDVYAGLRRVDGVFYGGCMDSSLANCQNCSVAEIYYCCGFAQSTLTKSSSSKMLKLPPGDYELYVKAKSSFIPDCSNDPNTTSNWGNCQYLAATASLTYSDGPDSIPRSREAGGIRISEIKSCPDNDPDNCLVKKYTYETTTGISQGHLFRRRNLFKSLYSTFTNGQTTYFENYNSSSNVPLSGYSGSHIIYKQVEETQLINNTAFNGSKISTFNYVTPPDLIMPFLNKDNKMYQNGKLLKSQILNSSGVDEKVVINEYDFSENLGINQRVISFKTAIVGYPGNSLSNYINEFAIFSNNLDVDRLIRSREFDVHNTSNLEIDRNYTYDIPNSYLIQEQSKLSTGNLVKTEYEYSYNITSPLTIKNRISQPISIKKYLGNSPLATQKGTYKDWGGGIIAKEYTEYSKEYLGLEKGIIFSNYDENGNPLEIYRADGSKITFIWGYQNKYPIAKIENATYADVQSQVSNLKNLSNLDNDRTTGSVGAEGNLRDALTNLRNTSSLIDAQITTNTYDPLIGITSSTDVKGYTVYYLYDSSNRLEFVKDADGKIVKEFKYNYKGE